MLMNIMKFLVLFCYKRTRELKRKSRIIRFFLLLTGYEWMYTFTSKITIVILFREVIICKIRISRCNRTHVLVLVFVGCPLKLLSNLPLNFL